MKALKTICLLLTMIAVCACESYKEQLVGKWESDQLTEDGVTVKVTLTFQKSGQLNAFLTFDGRDDSEGVEVGVKGTVRLHGTWEIEGENLTFDLDKNDMVLNIDDVYSPDSETNAMLKFAMQEDPSILTQMKQEMKNELRNSIEEINGVHIIESISETTLLLQGEDDTETYHRK